ncbi:hypothetical protein D3C71_1289030 [compost metagenome]
MQREIPLLPHNPCGYASDQQIDTLHLRDRAAQLGQQWRERRLVHLAEILLQSHLCGNLVILVRPQAADKALEIGSQIRNLVIRLLVYMNNGRFPVLAAGSVIQHHHIMPGGRTIADDDPNIRITPLFDHETAP